jgi:hypothetical protein
MPCSQRGQACAKSERSLPSLQLFIEGQVDFGEISDGLADKLRWRGVVARVRQMIRLRRCSSVLLDSGSRDAGHPTGAPADS